MRKKQTMTAAELAATRERLGWDTEQMSREIGILPAEMEALEAGSLSVPAETAEIVRMLAALDERQAILRASGLPECARLDELEAGFAAVAAAGGEAREYALQTLVAHEAGCPVCQGRVAYLNEHAPPMPDLHLPLWMRAFGGLARLGDRLPAPLRPPPGPAGEHRRMGVFIGGYLTVFAVLLVAMSVVLELVAGRRGEDSVLEFAPVLPVLTVAYLVGGYVAGAAWDATRRIRHRFIGYVLRGAGTAAALYGAMTMVLPLLKDVDIPVLGYLAGVGILTVFGGLAGAGKWLKDRWMDDLPEPPDGQNPV
ncbi:MAG TPA: hypothetical protein VFT45_10855 [Longimicrobium sp.]|nr:hypothetical protein [Longimicrobium sp.]